MTATTTERDRNDTTPVLVACAGLVPWNVLAWMRSAERLGVRFTVVNARLEHDPGPDFGRVGGLPPPALEFIATHADAMRRVVLATPTVLM
jgi:hypothetical protein